MSKLNTLDDRINAYKAHIADARTEYEALALALAESPGDPQLIKRLGDIESEIAESVRLIERLQAAQREAGRRNSTAAKREELERVSANHDLVKKNIGRMHEIAAELLAKIESLAPLLSEYSTLADDNQGLGWSITRAGSATPEEADRRFQSLAERLRGNTGAIRAVLSDAIFKSGLGRVGVPLDPFVTVSPARTEWTLAQALERSSAGMLRELDAAVERHAAQLANEKA